MTIAWLPCLKSCHMNRFDIALRMVLLLARYDDGSRVLPSAPG